MIGLIATDFDGTIHDVESVPHISPDFAHWLRFAQGSGTKWVICSGRQLNDELATELRPLKGDPMPDFIVTVEREIQVRRDGWYEPDTTWNARCAADHASLFTRAKDHLDEVRQWIAARGQADIYEDGWSPLNVIADTLVEADVIHRHMNKEFESVPELIVVRNSVFFRTAHHQYNKGTALAEIARRLGLKKKSVFAAGDHFNDLTMLDGKYAGMVAAPSNAIPEVKAVVSKVGGYVARQPYSLGVLEALRFFDRETEE